MSDPNETSPPALEYETPTESRRIGFLTKLNPRATRTSAARKAALFGGVAGAVCFLMVGVRHWHTAPLPWGWITWAAVFGAITGAAFEWQGTLGGDEEM